MMPNSCEDEFSVLPDSCEEEFSVLPDSCEEEFSVLPDSCEEEFSSIFSTFGSPEELLLIIFSCARAAFGKRN